MMDGRVSGNFERVWSCLAVVSRLFQRRDNKVAGLGLLVADLEQDIQFFLVLILPASATVWADTRRARKLWKHEREVPYALQDIIRRLDFRSSITRLALEVWTRCSDGPAPK
jgi:hypothetical protein